MTAATANYTVEQGTNTTIAFRVWLDVAKTQPRDLTGFVPHSQWRDRNGLLILDLPASVFTISTNTLFLNYTPDMTSPLSKGTYAYDIELISPANSTERLLKGRVTLDPEQTK